MSDPVIRRVRRAVDDSKIHGGLCAGMPTVKIDAADAERLCVLAESALSAPRVPDGWRTARGGHDWPTIGCKYLIKTGRDQVLQEEIYEFGQDGGGECFWIRDDIDLCPAFDPENDLWLPIDSLLTAAPEARSEAETQAEGFEKLARKLRADAEQVDVGKVECTTCAQTLEFYAARLREGGN